jgi:F0F1-type ATP synthase assembly protein I
MPGPDIPEPGAGGPGNWREDFGPFLTMGMELAFAVVGMFFLGRWLDGLLDIAPWGMYCGLIIGIAGGLIRFIRRAMAMGDTASRKTGR